MDTIEAIKKRRSIRQFSAKPVPREALVALIDAARYAATARNEQPWEFVVVTDKKKLGELGSIADHGRFIAQSAACVAVYCIDTKYYLEDGCAATENVLLAAAAMGIGSCWVAGDKKPYCDMVSEALGVPPAMKLVSLIALGYPAVPSAMTVADKKPLDDMLHWERFS